MKNEGFSLLELLLVTGIIAIFTVLAISSSIQDKRNKALLYASKQLSGDIRGVQNSSVSVLETGGSVPIGGYGISISTATNDSYKLFGDSNGSKAYDSGEDISISPVSLPSGIIIDSISSGNPTDIVFAPPYGQVYRNGVSGFSDLTITIKKSGSSCPSSSDCKTITVNKEGLVSE